MSKEWKPLVAICIPVYEKLNLFKRLEASVLMQNYQNYFVVITDNSASDDIELYIAESPLSDMKDFVYIHNDRQLGASGNANKCMMEGLKKGADYIKLMHQDDFFSFSDSLEKMVHKIVMDQTAVLFAGDYEVFGNYRRKRITKEKYIENIQRDLSFVFRANVLGAPSVMLFEAMEIRFDANLCWLLDVDFYLRLLKGRQFSYIYEPLISIGHDGDQLTDFCMQHPGLVMKETLIVYKRYRWLHRFKNRLCLLKTGLFCAKCMVKNLFQTAKEDNVS